MKARSLAFLISMLLTSAVFSQDHQIIEEALKATPPGFTDLVPNRSQSPPKLKTEAIRVYKKPVKFESTNPSPVLDPTPSIRLQFQDQDQDQNLQQLTTDLDAILKAHQNENDEFMRKLSKVHTTPQ